MLKSMTGYGKANFKNEDLSIHIETKSVNHRYLDISVRLPYGFLEYEDSIRQLVRSYIKRGKVDVFVTIESDSLFEKQLHVNYELLESYIQTLQHIKRKHNLSTTLSLDHILQLPELLTVVEKENKSSMLDEILVTTCSIAVQNLVSMREKEGEMLHSKIVNNLDCVMQFLQKIKIRFEQLESIIYERLQDRIYELVHDKMEIDESRLLTEVALLSEKTNIQEEVIRLESHCKQFQSVLQEKDAVGRKLDFLIQEMNREINTIGSKANDLMINRDVVNMKSELEKMREQIQNIE
ncbi:YicC/YloC family endoribonuclease [Pueribacillus sp. YX66]|uniref:YicC/YloC family endoribonuclease n=1 Tax=Pueribacillus sp. YX66 TaxID=3229242 RepID=UPI00358D909D